MPSERRIPVVPWIRLRLRHNASRRHRPSLRWRLRDRVPGLAVVSFAEKLFRPFPRLTVKTRRLAPTPQNGIMSQHLPEEVIVWTRAHAASETVGNQPTLLPFWPR